jgi:hypothetical protein
MAKALVTKLKLFKAGVAAANAYLGMAKNIYLCPICAQEFPIDSVHDGRLTLEHVPPKAAGGKWLVLTCRECNSNSGHSIDSAAARRDEMESIMDILAGKKDDDQSRRAEMSVGGFIVPVRLSRAKGTTEFRPVPAASNPESLGKSEEFFKKHARLGTGEGERITISVSLKNFHLGAMISDLKIGFLAAFAFLGYRFALHPNLVPVRQQILQPEIDLLAGKFYSRLTSDPHQPFMLVAITEPVACVAAVIQNRVVLMPEPDGPGNLYDSLPPQNPGVRFTGIPLGWPKTMELRWDLSQAPT